MTNIPTDLLRTFVAVVDLRSFTKAAVSLGVTQPAVSAQIKRLQFLIGDDIFDRSAQGVSLTPHGEIVLSYTRRLLSLNDQIVGLGAASSGPKLTIRVGTPSSFVAALLPGVMAPFRESFPDVRFSLQTDVDETLMRALHAGEIDVFVGLSHEPPHDAEHSWVEPMVWVRAPQLELTPGKPVPLVSHGEQCVHHRLAVNALKTAGMEWEVVFASSNASGLAGAVRAGLGVMPMARHRLHDTGFHPWEDAPLPKLPDLYRGIYIREGGNQAAYEQLADDIAAALNAAASGRKKRTPVTVVNQRTSAA